MRSKIIPKKIFLLICLFSCLGRYDILVAAKHHKKNQRSLIAVKKALKLSVPYLLLNQGVLGQELVHHDYQLRFLRGYNGTQLLSNEDRNLLSEYSVNKIAADAAEEYRGIMYLDSSDLELTYDRKFKNEQKVGVYFDRIDVPSGAKITSAFLQFEADESSSGSVTLEIFGEDTDQSSSFVKTRNDISNRRKTSNKVTWKPRSWNRGEKGSAQKSADIKAVIQEIIDRPGWKKGNSLSIIIQRSGIDKSLNTRVAETDPDLSITYTLNEGDTPEPEDDDFYHSHSGAGKVSRSNGYFSLQGQKLSYNSKGGLTKGGRVSTTASTGDYEIVSFGASHGAGDQFKDQYFDKNKMLNQDFWPIAVKGEKDKKVEMWARKNSGQGSIDIPADARAYTFLVLETKGLNWNLRLLEANTVRSSGTSYSVPQVTNDGLKVLSYFSDDSVELTNIGEGALAYQEWGFGDGDGFAVSLYRPDVSQPDRISIKNHDARGRQYVGINAVFFLALDNPPGNPQDNNTELMRPAADAAEEKGGRLNLLSSDLELVNDNGEQIVGINFQNINIPKGASIENAYIQFQADETSSGSLELEIFAEDVGDSRIFSNKRKISVRPLTSASVIWKPEAWNIVGEAGSKQRTTNIGTILQELVSRSDWTAGNAVSFIIKRSSKDQSTNKRVAETVSNPKLHVSFSSAENNEDSADEVVILAFGDSGTGDSRQMSVADSMKEVCSFEDCDFGLALGDNIYENGVTDVDDPQFKTKFEDPYGPLGIKFNVVYGNHDAKGNIQAQIDYSKKSKWWDMPDKYYAKIVDGVQLIGLDTNDFDAEQLKFVEETLQNTSARWTIVFGHHPIYSYGMHGNNGELIDELLPLLCEHDKVVYISGHEHDLQVLDSGCGVPLFVSGAAGKLREEGTGSRTVWAESTYGYVIFRVSDDKLKVKYYGEDRQLLFEETYY